MTRSGVKGLLWVVVVVGLAAAALWFWLRRDASAVPEGFVTGNGRIEATEINIATKLAGRVERILVDEGDYVVAGQPLAYMQTDVLDAQLAEAQALLDQARHGLVTAKAQVAMRESDLAAAHAVVVQRETELSYHRRRLERLQAASEQDATSVQEVDEQITATRAAEADLAAAKAQASAAEAAVAAAKAEAVGAESTVLAREATVRRIQAEIDDSVLSSPRDGRVQYRVAEPGEVLAAGGRVLNVIDLSDVYMTFFLPERAAGRVAMGTEVRLVLDAAPEYVIPASVSFVASAAQFTPKTVETAEERQKLMFRVRASIDPELLRSRFDQVKTGLPGVAWIKLDPQAEWPDSLQIRIPDPPPERSP